ncbi:thioredoxin family protein [Patescibacteria group bacterium]|nr:thioredoxin family protein [Patescibacteria group bacterium]
MIKNNILKISFLIIIIALTLSACSSTETTNNEEGVLKGAKVEYLGGQLENPQASLYFFWGDGCPHCANQKVFLNEMKDKYPDLEIKMYETYKNRENAKALQDMAQTYNVTARGVPMTFIGDFEPIIGFSSRMEFDIEEKIEYCLENDCIDPASKL